MNCKTFIEQGFGINMIVDEDGFITPDISDVLRYVGLTQIDMHVIGQVDRLLSENEYKKAIEIVSYQQDITFKIACAGIIKYVVVLAGLDLKYNECEDWQCLTMAGCLNVLAGMSKFFPDINNVMVIELFNNEGFKSDIIEKLIFEIGCLPNSK